MQVSLIARLVFALALVLTSSAMAAPPKPKPKPDTTEETTAKARYEMARTAYKEGRYFEAAPLFDEAHAYFKDATLLWNAGRSWERSGELERAADRFATLLARDDVPAELQAEARDAVARVEERKLKRLTAAAGPERIALLTFERDEALAAGHKALAQSRADALAVEIATWEASQVKTPSTESDTTLELVLMSAGGAVAAAGLVMAIVGQGQLDEITAAQDKAENGAVTRLTRAEALDKESSGTTLRTVGFVAGGLGLATAAAGVVLLLMDGEPAVEGRTGVTVAPTRGGLLCGWTVGF